MQIADKARMTSPIAYIEILQAGQVVLDLWPKKIYDGYALEGKGMAVNLKTHIEKAGGYSKVAGELGTTRQVVWAWAHVLKKVPPRWVNAFSKIMDIPRHQLRPDLYPKNRELD